MEFTYQNPTLIEFGQDRIQKLDKLIPHDKKVLIVYGGGSIKKNGIYTKVTQALENHIWFEFSGIEANPTKETLDKAVEFAREKKVDFVLAVGGGSVIDGAKYIVCSFYHKGDGWDLLDGSFTPDKALPLGVVLTLAATGSESNPAAVITKKETHEKRFFKTPLAFPKFAILNPDVLKSLDNRQLANGLIDSFVHTCEQYLTIKHNALVQDSYSEALLKTLIVLSEEFENRDDNWYANLMWAANQALNGLIGLGVPQDWGTHFIGHELSGLYGIDHARTLAIIQPNLLRVLSEQRADKLLQMGRNVFDLVTSNPKDVIVKIEQLYSSLGVDLKLSSYTQDKEIKQKVTEMLSQHGFDVFGVGGTIDKNIVEQILDKSI